MRPITLMIASAFALLAGCAADQGAPTAQPPSAEAARGRAFAEDVCASCHAVDAGALYSPDTAAPTFDSIANTPGMTRIALSAWMQGAHQDMPQLIVDQDRIDDLWAYLSTLERRATPPPSN
jgi:mono/diheme cytochrome c family protein